MRQKRSFQGSCKTLSGTNLVVGGLANGTLSMREPCLHFAQKEKHYSMRRKSWPNEHKYFARLIFTLLHIEL